MALVYAVLIGFASYRASRFLARDTLIAPWRHRFFRRFPPTKEYCLYYRAAGLNGKPGVWQMAATVEQSGRKTSLIGRLVECFWCSSVWFAAALTAIAARYTSVPLPGLVWAASCTVAGLAGRIEET